MASKKKKAIPAKGKKTVFTKQKTVAKKKANKSEPGSGDKKPEVRSVFFQAGSGSKQSVMDILKKEKHLAFKRRFEIWVLKDVKRKKLVFQVFELIKGTPHVLPQHRMELKMHDLNGPPEKVTGYKEILAGVKKSIDNYADSTVNNLKQFLWSQFGASIDMLQNAIRLWPEKEWETDKRFFYNAYHVLVFLDYYLTDSQAKFRSLLPFTITKKDAAPMEAIDDVIPDRIYTKQELLDYGEVLQQKCRAVISMLTEDRLGDRWIEKDGNMNYGWLELLLYNMRHVQHHVAQLNMLLRQKINDAPKWVARAGHGL